jgi:D-3-phosphoglycerate dehydrogenase
MLLALMNNMLRADKQIRNGKWLRNENRGYEIHGKTIGIIGYGNTGSAFARRLCGFGAEILAYDKYKSGYSDQYVKEAHLSELFEKADIVSFHVPLTSETHFMADSDFFEKFQKSFWLINTSRGQVVKTNDLVNSLKSGRIRGAALDVLEYEKIHFENLYSDNLSESFRYLVESENVILTPHIAGRTYESEVKMAEYLVEKIVKILK